MGPLEPATSTSSALIVRALAPRLYADLLEVPVPEHLSGPGVPELLSGLDEATCRALPSVLLPRLRGAVLQRLRANQGKLSARRLPPLPEGVDIAALALSPRAARALENITWTGWGREPEPGALQSLAIRDILRAKNCGWKSLLEITAAFESARPQPVATCLEEELATLLLQAISSDRQRAVTLRFFGLDGRGGATSAVIAHEHGVSHGYVKNLVQRTKWILRYVRPPMPRLDAALRLAASLAPAPAEVVAQELASAGIARAPFDPFGLVKAAEILEIDRPIALVSTAARRMVVRAETAAAAGPVAGLAQQLVRRDGLGRVVDLEGRLEPPVNIELLREAIEARGDCRWLGEDRFWFFVGDPMRSPLYRLARKAFAGVRRRSASSLLDALYRSPRPAFTRAPRPPLGVLLDLFAGLPGFRTEGSHIECVVPIDPGDDLTDVERLFLSTFVTHGPFLPFGDLGRLLSAMGRKTPHFATRLPCMPFLEKVRPGIYGLADEGLRVEFQSICAGEPPPPVNEHSITYQVIPTTLATGALLLPPWFGTQSLEPLCAVGDARIGTVVREPHLVLGLRPWLEREAAQAGCTLRLWRDADDQVLRASLA